MYLVDTSVWIDYFREKKNTAVDYFLEILDNDIPFGVTPLIYQELLQGAASHNDFKWLSEYMSTQRIFYTKHALDHAHAAAKIYFDCRRKGVTISSTIDCMIAQVAIEHKLILLHHDKDYERIASVVTTLKLYNHGKLL